jgi:hypothetical protein
MARNSCSNVECGVSEISWQFTMSDAVEHDFPRGRLGSLDGIQLRIPVQQDIQLRNLRNPSAIDFLAEIDCELHVPAYHRCGSSSRLRREPSETGLPDSLHNGYRGQPGGVDHGIK